MALAVGRRVSGCVGKRRDKSSAIGNSQLKSCRGRTFVVTSMVILYFSAEIISALDKIRGAKNGLTGKIAESGGQSVRMLLYQGVNVETLTEYTRNGRINTSSHQEYSPIPNRVRIGSDCHYVT